ncbi:Hypothetical protein NTJ_01211 [Nesidiocoris tenuis]|uniref:Serpin domain-containing protein n=1 Tax=Nesidiocoris tenuis TaxID=355587 RepID=A0ABN7A802_9HEMI|nr:Hypothetical protein NTJ_01211 [Nesidiocoris tenuis]
MRGPPGLLEKSSLLPDNKMSLGALKFLLLLLKSLSTNDFDRIFLPHDINFENEVAVARLRPHGPKIKLLFDFQSSQSPGTGCESFNMVMRPTHLSIQSGSFIAETSRSAVSWAFLFYSINKSDEYRSSHLDSSGLRP